jgi:PE family protein
MADQLPQFQDLATIGAVTGIADIALIAEEAAALVAQGVDSGGGKYQFHPDELRSVLQQWQELQDTITTAQGSVRTRVPHSGSVMAPGNENASNVAADAAHTTNLAYQDYLASMSAYVQGYVDNLNRALDNYMRAEQGNSDLASSAQNHLQA